MNKLHLLGNQFLTGGMSSIPSGQSIGSIGNKVIMPIINTAKVIALLVGLVSLLIAAVTLMISKKQDQRSEVMTKIIWVFFGIAIVGLALSIVGFIGGTFLK